jgi:hypothetical protein
MSEEHSPEAEAVASQIDDATASVVDTAHAVASDAVDNSQAAAESAAASAEHASGASQVADEAAAELLRKQGELDWMTRAEQRLQNIENSVSAIPGTVAQTVAEAIAAATVATQAAAQPIQEAVPPLDPEGEGHQEVDAETRADPPSMRPKEKRRKWI